MEQPQQTTTGAIMDTFLGEQRSPPTSEPASPADVDWQHVEAAAPAASQACAAPQPLRSVPVSDVPEISPVPLSPRRAGVIEPSPFQQAPPRHHGSRNVPGSSTETSSRQPQEQGPVTAAASDSVIEPLLDSAEGLLVGTRPPHRHAHRMHPWQQPRVAGLMQNIRTEAGAALSNAGALWADWLVAALLAGLVVLFMCLPVPAPESVYITPLALQERFAFPHDAKAVSIFHAGAPLMALLLSTAVLVTAAPMWWHWQGVRWWRLMTYFLLCVLTAGAICIMLQVLIPTPHPDFAGICWPDGNVQWLNSTNSNSGSSAHYMPGTFKRSVVPTAIGSNPYGAGRRAGEQMQASRPAIVRVTHDCNHPTRSHSLAGSQGKHNGTDGVSGSKSISGSQYSMFAGGQPNCSCSPAEVHRALRSFPSTSATWTAAAWGFLTLWLLHVLSDTDAEPPTRHPSAVHLTRSVERAHLIPTESEFVAVPIGSGASAAAPAGEDNMASMRTTADSSRERVGAAGEGAGSSSPAAWQLLLALLPVLAALLLGAVQVGVHDAHPQDVLAGWAIGGSLAWVFWWRLSRG